MTIVPAPKTADNTFRKLWDAGYKRLVPIVPPDAELSERSTLYKRMKDGKSDGRGKSPGVKGGDGLWRGFDFVKHEAAAPDLDAWHGMAAGTGIKTGRGLIAIDIDTTDEAAATSLLADVERILGPSVKRYGRAPKVLLPYRLDGDVVYDKVSFETATEPCAIVELLSEGRQFVARGVHPGTRKPYRWPDGLPAYDDLPVVTPERVQELFDHFNQTLPKAQRFAAASVDRTKVDQASLAGDAALLASAVAALPNTQDLFPARPDYLNVGYALKGALPSDDAAAFELWCDWAAKWDGGENDPELMAEDWRRMKPPFALGAGYIYDLATKHGGWMGQAEVWFDKVDIGIPMSGAPAAGIEWLRPNDWEGRDPPVLEWLVREWVPAEGIVTLLYGDGGTGKTRLAQELAACMAAGGTAAGFSWLGQVTGAGRVMCFFCEDSEGELWRRQREINRRLGLSMADIDANFRLTSRVSEDNLLMAWDRSSGTAKLLPTWHQLRADALAFKPDLIVVDTIADTFGGSEIERAQVNAFIKSCLGRLGREVGCKAVLALGHPSVAGMASGTGTSGSTGWSNAVRSRLYLSRVEGSTDRDARELTGKKLNVGAGGAVLKLKWRNGGFDVIASSVPGDGAPSDVAGFSEECVVQALRANADQSMSLSKNATNYAPKLLLRSSGVALGALTLPDVEGALMRLQARGAITYEEVDRKDGKAVRGLRIVEDKLSAHNRGVFD